METEDFPRILTECAVRLLLYVDNHDVNDFEEIKRQLVGEKKG